MANVYNVLIVAELHNLDDKTKKELCEKLEEQGLEKIPTLLSVSAWEVKYESQDESEAKDKAIQAVHNACRTYPFELRMLVQCGTGQILRRKKVFEA